MIEINKRSTKQLTEQLFALSHADDIHIHFISPEKVFSFPLKKTIISEYVFEQRDRLISPFNVWEIDNKVPTITTYLDHISALNQRTAQNESILSCPYFNAGKNYINLHFQLQVKRLNISVTFFYLNSLNMAALYTHLTEISNLCVQLRAMHEPSGNTYFEAKQSELKPWTIDVQFPKITQSTPINQGKSQDKVTPRERQVIELLRFDAYRSNKELALLLHMSPRTIEDHIRNIKKKLNVSNRYKIADALIV
ncbi:response regulator transcription factor [Cysteiniphilum marinum]|uniref:response regulator transcription factor n=1 Tax=Cysteiniphilum marinum TaxID=2774191 RepID=UPI00193C4C5A|nr:helix-turn-helix transcriptional regulator [Cysteiniphilum marinum]